MESLAANAMKITSSNESLCLLKFGLFFKIEDKTAKLFQGQLLL